LINIWQNINKGVSLIYSLIKQFILRKKFMLNTFQERLNFKLLLRNRINLQLSLQLLLVAILLLVSVIGAAQQPDNNVASDSALMPSIENDTTEVSNIESDNNGDETNEQVILPDTILINNQLLFPTGYHYNLQREKPYLYAKNLDSLLLAMQRNQAATYQAKFGRLSAIEMFFSAPATKLVFWIIALAFLAFIIIKLFFTQGFFQRQSATSNVKEITTEQDEHPGDKDYNRLVRLAIEKQDYRLATRYLYLQSLYKLITNGSISFAADKTNFQYLAELYGKPYHKEFASLTLQYEYVWYGGFSINEMLFKNIQSSFTKFNQAI